MFSLDEMVGYLLNICLFLLVLIGSLILGCLTVGLWQLLLYLVRL